MVHFNNGTNFPDEMFLTLKYIWAKVGKMVWSGPQAREEGTMFEFLIGLFIGSSFGFILAGILVMGRDADEYAKRKHYRRDLKLGAGSLKGRPLGLEHGS